MTAASFDYLTIMLLLRSCPYEARYRRLRPRSTPLARQYSVVSRLALSRYRLSTHSAGGALPLDPSETTIYEGESFVHYL